VPVFAGAEATALADGRAADRPAAVFTFTDRMTMVHDPKKLVDVTKKLEKHLENFKAKQKELSEGVAGVKKIVQDLDKLSKWDPAPKISAALKEFGLWRSVIDNTVESTVHLEQLVKSSKATKEYDMLYRKFAEAKKQYEQISEEFNEKFDAHQKKKGDKKAQMEYELALKAYERFSKTYADLLRETQDLVPSRAANTAIAMLKQTLPEAITNYKQALDQVLRLVGSSEALEMWRKKLEKAAEEAESEE
jgi:tetratricopeptide (TPR) repeat protein